MAGLGDSSSVSSGIESAAFFLASASSCEVTEETIVSTGGVSIELDLKTQRLEISQV